MEPRRTGFWWRNRELEDENDKIGEFTLDEARFFLQLVFKVNGRLFILAPHIDLDFTNIGRGEVEMEIHDAEGQHFAVLRPNQAEEVTSVLLQNWNGNMLREKLSPLPIAWL